MFLQEMDWVTFCLTTVVVFLITFFWIRHIRRETSSYKDQLSMLASQMDSDRRRRLLARHYFTNFKKKYPDLAENMAGINLEEMDILGVNLFKNHEKKTQ